MQVLNDTKPMTVIADLYQEAHKIWRDMSILTNFVDCHDKERFLSYKNDVASFKAALAFTICSLGIPTLYYGNEQGFTGGDLPTNRENLWGHMNRDHELYKFIKILNEFRRESNFFNYE